MEVGEVGGGGGWWRATGSWLSGSIVSSCSREVTRSTVNLDTMLTSVAELAHFHNLYKVQLRQT